MYDEPLYDGSGYEELRGLDLAQLTGDPHAGFAEVSSALAGLSATRDRDADRLSDHFAMGPDGEERRTVVITGRVADRYSASSQRRGGYESNLKPHHRAGFKPDRVAMWAVLLGVLLVLIAATSSHAATLVHLAH